MSSYIHPHFTYWNHPSALREVPATHPGVGNQALQRAPPREHHSVWPGVTPRIRLEGVQDGELVVRARGGEIKAFVVVVHMRVAVAADGLAAVQVVAALGDGGVDSGLVVAGAGAGVDALALDGGFQREGRGWKKGREGHTGSRGLGAGRKGDDMGLARVRVAEARRRSVCGRCERLGPMLRFPWRGRGFYL